MTKQEEAKQNQVLDLLMSTGLNWTVTKESLVSVEGNKPTTSFGLFRKDTGAHLNTVTDRYQIYQNYELAEAIVDATNEIGLTTTRGGQLSGGQKVYLQAEMPSTYIGKSDVKRWLTGIGFHGGGSVGFGSSDVVIVCMNTFYMAYGELSKFRHTASIQDRVKEFIKGFKIAIGIAQQQVETYKIMANVPLRDEIFANIMKACFDVSLDAKTDEISTKEKNKLLAVTQAIETELKLEGATLWGLFNGITRYTNHHAVKPKVDLAPELQAEKLKTYLMTGGGYETNLKAYKTITNWLIDHNLLLLEGVPK